MRTKPVGKESASAERFVASVTWVDERQRSTRGDRPLLPFRRIPLRRRGVQFHRRHIRRAPLWMRRSGLERLWRLGVGPYRRAARCAACAYVFLLLGIGVDVVPAE